MTIAKLLLLSAAFALTACGDIGADVERAKQGAIDAGQEVLNAGAEVLDTRTACQLAGQSPAFCGCLSERLGNDITPEHVEALTEAVRATVERRPIEIASESGGADAATREALVQCMAQAAIQGAVAEGGN